MPVEVAHDDDPCLRPATRRQKTNRFPSESVRPVSPPEEATDESDGEEAEPVSDPLADGSMLCLGHLRSLLAEGRLDRVGVLELALKSARAKDPRQAVNEKIRRYGAETLSVEDYEKICKLPRMKLTRYSYNFVSLRAEMKAQTPVWHP